MPSPSEVLANLDDYGTWVAAVVAGLVAVGWLMRRAYRAIRETLRRARELGRKIDALDVLASRELTYGDDSTKDLARQAAGIALAVESLEERVRALEEANLAERVLRLEVWREALPYP